MVQIGRRIDYNRKAKSSVLDVLSLSYLVSHPNGGVKLTVGFMSLKPRDNFSLEIHIWECST